MKRGRTVEPSNEITCAFAPGERRQERESRTYSRGSARLGGFIAGLSGVGTTLFVEAISTGASAETDIITATPAVGFAVMATLIIRDSLRTSEEAGMHQARAEQYERDHQYAEPEHS